MSAADTTPPDGPVPRVCLTVEQKAMFAEYGAWIRWRDEGLTLRELAAWASQEFRLARATSVHPVSTILMTGGAMWPAYNAAPYRRRQPSTYVYLFAVKVRYYVRPLAPALQAPLFRPLRSAAAHMGRPGEFSREWLQGFFYGDRIYLSSASNCDCGADPVAAVHLAAAWRRQHMTTFHTHH